MTDIPRCELDEPVPAPVGAEVAVLIRDERHGVEVRVFASYEEAVRARAGIARDQWQSLAEVVDEMPDHPPADDEEAAELYFAHNDEQDASIRMLTVEPDPGHRPADTPTADRR